MMDSIKTPPLMDVKLLLPGTESFNAAWDTVRPSIAPLGVTKNPLYDRHSRCVGLVLNLRDLTVPEKQVDWEVTWNCISTVLTEAKLQSDDFSTSAQREDEDFLTVLELPAKLLINPSVTRLLQIRCQSLQGRGARLVLSVSSRDFSELPTGSGETVLRSISTLKNAGVLVAVDADNLSTFSPDSSLADQTDIISLTPGLQDAPTV